MTKVPPEIKAKLPLEQLVELLGVKISNQTDKVAHALCPFHNDKTPSFVINKANGTARCFSSSCADMPWPMGHIEFIKYYEHLPEEMAMDRLYNLAGEERTFDEQHDIMGRAARLLHENLDTPKVQQFFKEKGINAESLKDLIVGYSPSFEWFKQAISDIPIDQAARLELLRPMLFEDAILYPQFDIMGRVCGFRSRPFSGVPAKYVGNSGEFKLKPCRLYGLHTVKAGQRQIIIVEGPNDVLALRSAGLTNAVGFNGTTHWRGLDRYLEDHGYTDPVFVGDGDQAGQMAGLQAPPLVRVTAIPVSGMDPDEYVAQHGLLSMVNLVNEAKYPIQIMLESRTKNVPKTVAGRISLVKSLARELSEGLPPILLRILRDQIASLIGISADEVESIFSMVDISSEKLEERIVYHLATNGPLTDDIKMYVQPNMFSDPRTAKQAEQIYAGLSPVEMPSKVEGLTNGDIMKFVDIHKRRSVKRVLLKLSDSISNLAVPTEDIVTKAITNLADTSTEVVDVINAGELLEYGVKDAQAKIESGNRFEMSFGTNFPTTNRHLQGVRPNSMYVLAATQGVGKSALAFEWALSLAMEQDIPVLWISLEMSRAEMAVRALAKLSGIPAYNIQTGGLDDANMRVLYDNVIKYAGCPLYYVDTGAMNINQIVALARKMKVTKGVRIVFIDYLQLVDGGGRDQSMYERVGHISRMIKSGITMDRSVGLPVVAIAQLSKLAAKAEVPTAEHIAESYKIAQDADVFMTIRRRNKDEIAADQLNPDGQNYGNMLLNIDKNRSGQSKVMIGLLFHAENLRIKEVDA
jgi:replicative DNA helicase